jgi:hypothetical protein
MVTLYISLSASHSFYLQVPPHLAMPKTQEEVRAQSSARHRRYYTKHHDEVVQRQKQRYQLQRVEKQVCECGVTCRKVSMQAHRKTLKHSKAMMSKRGAVEIVVGGLGESLASKDREADQRQKGRGGKHCSGAASSEAIAVCAEAPGKVAQTSTRLLYSHIGADLGSRPDK